MSKGELHLNTGFATGHQPFPMDLRDYVDALYCYALVLCRNPTESEDLVQETCLRALRAMGKLRPDTNAKAWLFTILRNVWLNQLRQSRTAPQTVEFEADESIEDKTKGEGKDPHETYVSEFERKQVQSAIRQLSSEFREVILLREFEELSYQEIAALLGCPAGTVMSRLSRARSKLRDLLPTALIPRPGTEKQATDSNRKEMT